MKMRNLLPLLFFLCGCGAKSPQFEMPSFQQEVRGRVELLFSEDLPCKIVNKVEVYNSYLIVVGFFQKNFLAVYDKQSGELLNEAIFKGRGPNELVFFGNLDFNKTTGDMTFYDLQTNDILTCNIEDVMSGSASGFCKTKDNVNAWTKGAFSLQEGKMLMVHRVSPRGSNPQKRFVIYDGDSVCFSYNEFPILDTTTSLNFLLYEQSSMSISPDRTRLVEGVGRNGATLEVFDLGVDEMMLHWVKYLIPVHPDAGKKRGKKDFIYGFTDVYAAGEGIVTVIGDETQDKIRSICIFDWDGTPVKRIVLEDDYNPMKACMDDEGNIYAVVRNESGYYYLARIIETETVPTYSIPEEKIRRFNVPERVPARYQEL